MMAKSVLKWTHAAVELELHAERCVWHGASRSLFVADLHLGKETTFQRAGVAVPSGSTAEALDRLAKLIEHYEPQRVVVLGDLVHASDSFSDSFRASMQRFWNEQTDRSPTRQWVLVEGNHDRRARRELAKWPVTIVKPPWSLGDLVCIHDPLSEFDAIELQSHQLVLAGHLHPSYRMRDNGEKLCCFALRCNLLILPAFNEFTGRRPIDTKQLKSVFVIAGQELARMDL